MTASNVTRRSLPTANFPEFGKRWLSSTSKLLCGLAVYCGAGGGVVCSYSTHFLDVRAGKTREACVSRWATRSAVFCGIRVDEEGTLESALSENNYASLYCVPLSNVLLGCCFYGRAGGLERGEAAPWVPAWPYILFVSADSDGRTKRRPVAELPLRHKENEALTNQSTPSAMALSANASRHAPVSYRLYYHSLPHFAEDTTAQTRYLKTYHGKLTVKTLQYVIL